MTGAWQRGLSFCSGLDINTNLANCAGSDLLTTSSFVKSGWVQCIASTATNTSWALISIVARLDTFGWRWAVDVGVGAAGSETVLVSNLMCYGDGLPNGSQILIPLKIKAGTRVSMRGSTEATTGRAFVQIHTFGDTFISAAAGGAVTDYGFSTGTDLGTLVDCGTSAHTKGTYTQITASLTFNIAGFFLGFDTRGLTTGTVGTVAHLTDIAVGASGSEKIIIPDYQHVTYCYTSPSSGNVTPTLSPYIPMPLKSGTRIAVRGQCSTAATPDRTFGVTFYGVRQ